MDSHSFRLVGQELLTLLSGARIEKIHGPVQGTLVFQVYALERKFKLVMRFERQDPLLFITETTFTNPLQPKGDVMRLRKYVGGRRLLAGAMQFEQRRLIFPIANAGLPPEHFLLLDCREGAKIVSAIPEDFDVTPQWPTNDVVKLLADTDWSKKEHQDIWQQYGVLTPLLRETLAELEPLDALALMVDLEVGGGDIFLYANQQGAACFYAAWPLPDKMVKRRRLQPITAPSSLVWLTSTAPCLALTSAIDEQLYFSRLGEQQQKEHAAPAKQSMKKQNKLLEKLAQEEKRLLGLLALREDAEALQENLWQFDADARCEEVVATRSKDAEGAAPRRIALNNLMSIKENMLYMFKQSARGKRGLRHLEERKKAVFTEPLNNEFSAPAQEEKGQAVAGREDATNAAGLANLPYPEEKDVARFVSVNGFTLLRGKSAKGNARLLKIGQGHDYWLHAKDGPSAHVIIRRNHATQEVPEETFLQAARLVGEKSWQRHDAKVEIMVAALRHVRSIKGAAAGAVRVDVIEKTFFVFMDDLTE